MNQPAIQIKAVTKQFGQTRAVNHISLDIASGEFFSLLGPSGCGKTTLLRMIAGFDYPTLGQIIVAGKDMSGVPPHKRPVNMVFQSYALFPHLSVFENVAFGLRSSGISNKEELQERVSGALDLVRLSAFGSRYPDQLSGGQQQRVALARAVVNRPAVLLLDEPLSALDLKIRQEMQEELARLQKELQMTFVMVTHDQGEALALSDRMAVFYQGNLEQYGSPDEIYRAPRTVFVADFIGQTNLIDATVAERRSPYLLVSAPEGLRFWVKENSQTATAVGAEVKAWMRTDALNICAAGNDEEQCGGTPAESPERHKSAARETNLKAALLNRFKAVITNRSYQGTTTDYRLSVGDQLSLRATSSNTSDAPYSVGQTVLVAFNPDDASVLPPDAEDTCKDADSTPSAAGATPAAVNGGARQIG